MNGSDHYSGIYYDDIQIVLWLTSQCSIACIISAMTHMLYHLHLLSYESDYGSMDRIITVMYRLFDGSHNKVLQLTLLSLWSAGCILQWLCFGGQCRWYPYGFIFCYITLIYMSLIWVYMNMTPTWFIYIDLNNCDWFIYIQCLVWQPLILYTSAYIYIWQQLGWHWFGLW